MIYTAFLSELIIFDFFEAFFTLISEQDCSLVVEAPRVTYCPSLDRDLMDGSFVGLKALFAYCFIGEFFKGLLVLNTFCFKDESFDAIIVSYDLYFTGDFFKGLSVPVALCLAY